MVENNSSFKENTSNLLEKLSREMASYVSSLERGEEALRLCNNDIVKDYVWNCIVDEVYNCISDIQKVVRGYLENDLEYFKFHYDIEDEEE